MTANESRPSFILSTVSLRSVSFATSLACSACAAFALACNVVEPDSDTGLYGDDDGGGGDDRPQWLADEWYHDDGRESYAEYADFYLKLGADGVGDYYDDHGIFEYSGEWSLSGHTLTIDGTTRDITWTENCSVIEVDGKTFIGTIGRTRVDCPSEPEPLSALERCLVGEWSKSEFGDVVTSQKWWTFTEDRTYLEVYDDSGYTSGGSAGSVEGQWRLTTAGELEISYPNGSSETRGDLAGILANSRDSDVDPGCDEAALNDMMGGCAAGDPYECAGDNLRDCADGTILDCDTVCVQNGWSGASDPACGPGSEGYELCLCV